jgi:hypothetical protein
MKITSLLIGFSLSGSSRFSRRFINYYFTAIVEFTLYPMGTVTQMAFASN